MRGSHDGKEVPIETGEAQGELQTHLSFGSKVIKLSNSLGKFSFAGDGVRFPKTKNRCTPSFLDDLIGNSLNVVPVSFASKVQDESEDALHTSS